MNYSKKTFFTLLVATFCLASTSMAQKFAHINSQQLLVESPLVKTADTELAAFQEGLISVGKGMVKDFETAYGTYVAEVEAGGLSKVQMTQREEQLGKQQEAIQKYEIEVQQRIAQKREELYKPILDKAKVAIEAIGKEGSYTMIFDTSTNALLFAVESEDILPKVKAKLGW